ncbi:uncharacterized protein CLIB1423_01S01134 [[Candida] railenensis]|uniref:Uncharacterized protein n=1 Tax=[Candida] railenensis TaxID=45579 RepID=A0A9P0QK14_9ASCO|nr:uncharacterized protein CLIB1423_01S01134 [[Candida] railenensis]
MSSVAGGNRSSRHHHENLLYHEMGPASARNSTTTNNIDGSRAAGGSGANTGAGAVGGVGGSTSVGAATLIPGVQDIPPDMAILLQKLEEDFTINKSIDQWTYINRREEIIQSVQRLHQQQQQQDREEAALDGDLLQKPIYPRRPQLPMTPSSTSASLSSSSSSSSLLSVLAKRAAVYKTEQVIVCLDSRGKETSSMIWEKLYLKAVKVACEIKNKLALKNSDAVVLLYKENEVAEFTVALFGCFMANVPAIPIHQDISLPEVLDIIKVTSSRLLLFSDTVSRDLDKLTTSNAGHSKFTWPTKLLRWRTTELGSAKKSELVSWVSKSNQQQLAKQRENSDLAYIEYSRSPVGELRGIAVSHRTIQHQMNCLNETLSSLPASGGGLQRSVKDYQRSRKVVLATLDTRNSIGLILGVMFTIYSGNLLCWAPQRAMEIQGLYAHIISKVRASLLLADYFGLKRVTYDYQSSPNATRYFSKTQKVDFSSVKWVLVNALTVDGEFTEILSQRYLKPLGCQDPEKAVIPMLTLSEYGGMVISLRDWLGGKDKLGIEKEPNEDETEEVEDIVKSSELSGVLIDKEALSRNIVKVIESNPSNFDELSNDVLRVDSFGYPLPDATLAVVNPESNILSRKGELGEIWIDSPCLSGGFYGLRNESKSIFHAKCRDHIGTLEMDFLRTGLLGFTYEGKVYILGLYEDRIRQRVSWIDQKIYNKLNRPLIIGNGSRYHYSSHLLATLANEVRSIYDCTIFDVFIGNEYLPVAIVEAEVIRKVVGDPDNEISGASGDGGGGGKGGVKGSAGGGSDGIAAPVQYSPIPLNEPVLNQIAQRCFDVLHKKHYLRLYCVLVVDCDTLPKIMRSGGTEIANMLCKRRFLDGSLRAEFVKFFVRNSISMIPHGEDVIGGIWSPFISKFRSSTISQFPQQYSTIDYREKSIDDKTGAPLTDFKTIIDILKFRVSKSGDSTAFQNLDNFGKSSSANKALTWKKLEQRIYAVCSYLIDKAAIKPGQYVILMYSLSEEFIIAVYACLFCGIIPIPMLPFDSNRIGEDFPAFVGVIRDFDVQDILVNEEVEKFLKNGPVADGIKKMNNKRGIKPQRIKNTTKLVKFSNAASLNSKIAKYQAAVNFRDEKSVALVWLSFTSDHYRIGATLSHKNILGICKVFKETCNLSSKSSIVGCVRHASGIGFVQAVLLGVFLGTTTYLNSPVSYAENPLSFFLSLAKYKVKDVFVTEQMLKYATIKFTPKGFNLGFLKNMMISTEGRVETDLLRKIGNIFQPTKLGASAMATVYYHCFNPMISTRSYMTVAPVGLYLDPAALRQGYVSVVNPSEAPNALYIQDSGMVPVCTEIAIVNPETNKVCNEGEFGEIWVNSEANLSSFTNGPKGPVDKFSKSQFMGKIDGGNENIEYLRTGDLGFLHNISITKTKGEVDDGFEVSTSKTGSTGTKGSEISTFQPLFVLGKISDTFEEMGLHHFPIDIENTIESCHYDIFRNGSCIFKCADFTVVVCESRRQRHFASLVPLIVNTVLSKHHLIVDIVAFMKKGEFPISRLGTKQRARIVDAWVQGVLPIVASYGVNNGENSMIKLVKEIDSIARDHPITGLKNPAFSYFDTVEEPDDVFADNRENLLTLNYDHKAVFTVSNDTL